MTFADDDDLSPGEDVISRDAGSHGIYGSSELSDVTSVTSGSYYIGEDAHQQPVSFIFV